MSDLMDRIDLRFDYVADRMQLYTLDQETGCWRWGGKIKKARCGYGQIVIYCQDMNPKKRMFYAHRVAYAFFNGADPGELCVMHSCDNPACINPDHLVLGTHADNMSDMAKKGRSTAGELNPRSKLSRSTVEAVIEKIVQGCSNVDIAEDLPVTHAQISNIRHGKAWRNLSESMGYSPADHIKFERRSMGCNRVRLPAGNLY